MLTLEQLEHTSINPVVAREAHSQAEKRLTDASDQGFSRTESVRAVGGIRHRSPWTLYRVWPAGFGARGPGCPGVLGRRIRFHGGCGAGRPLRFCLKTTGP